MSIYTDITFLKQLAQRLERFKIKQDRPFIANFRCPICGDSRKSKTKARGFVFEKPDSNALLYKCHNCGDGRTVGRLIKELDPGLYERYRLEKFREGDWKRKDSANVDFAYKAPEFEEEGVLDRLMDRVDKLPRGHVGRDYCEQRMIPQARLKDIFFIDDVSKIKQLSPKYKDKITGVESKLVFPFYSRRGTLTGVQCRAIGDNGLRYVTVHVDEDEPMVYNYDKVDSSKTIYVLEGPIDSLFLPNAVAVGTSDLKRFNIPNSVLVFDNQPRNKQIVSIMRKASRECRKVVVWPETIEAKDVNDMVLGGATPEEVLSIVQENTYQGLALDARLSEWSRIK